MSILSTPSDNKFTSQTYSIASQSKIILIKEDKRLFLRSALLAHSSPNQITSLFPIIDLFQHPSKITLNIKFLKSKKNDSFLSIFFLDLDLSDISKEKFNSTMKKSVQFHKQQFDLLKKNIVLKDISVKMLSHKEISNFMDGNLSRIMKKFSYDLETDREKELFQKAIFSNNKIKQINYKRESVIPPTEIILGTTISNKEIGVNSHVLFLTGKKEFRRSVIRTFVDYYTKQDQYNIVVFDFGLNISFDKTLSREFRFDDILLDPFSFRNSFSHSHQSLLVSYLSFIGKHILKLNDRQIGIFEEKLAFYLKDNKNYSWNSFLKFALDEALEENLSNSGQFSSFSSDIASGDFTTMLKTTESGLKSNDLELLLNKLRFLDLIFNPTGKDSLEQIFFKNHLDIFSIKSTPDQKSLVLYLFNLFYSLNEQKYKKFLFMFLEIDSVLFDNFSDLDIAWLHPDLRQALFDSSEIFSVKKIFNQLDTRIYASYVSNAPYTLLSKSTKDNIDQLQFLHDYLLLESPLLQRQEFFKLPTPELEQLAELPPIKIYKKLPKLLFASRVEFSYTELFSYFDINRKILSPHLKLGYISKNKSSYLLTSKSLELKKTITELLSYQPNLSLEENDFLIKISDPLAFNIFKQSEFNFDSNIDLLCTRLLSNQLLNVQNFNSFLLYHFLRYKRHLIDEKQLFYYLVVSLQTKAQINSVKHPEKNKKIEIFSLDSSPDNSSEHMMGYFSEIKTVLEEVPTEKENSFGTDTSQVQIALGDTTSQVQKNSTIPDHGNSNTKILTFPDPIKNVINTINTRINAQLPDSKLTFPDKPIFLVCKFLDQNVIDLLYNDLQNLTSITGKDSTFEDDTL